MSASDSLAALAVTTSINAMLAGGHFNVCVLDKAAKLLGVNAKGRAHDILASLHCVDYAQMPVDLRAAIPALIVECLGVEPTFQFPAPAPGVVVETACGKTASLTQRLLSGFGGGA